MVNEKWAEKMIATGCCTRCGAKRQNYARLCDPCGIKLRLYSRKRKGCKPWKKGSRGRPPFVKKDAK